MKKTGFLCVLIGLFFCMAACSGRYIPQYSKLVYESDETDRQRLASAVFTNYLKEYEKINVAADYKLKDFSIEDITDIADTNDGFRFWVSFSVQPYFRGSSSWMAGNGTEDGAWIRDKLLNVKVKKDGSRYVIKEMGTSA